MKIGINKNVYSIHPIYDLYAADERGNVIHKIKKELTKGRKFHNGYMIFNVKNVDKSKKRI